MRWIGWIGWPRRRTIVLVAVMTVLWGATALIDHATGPSGPPTDDPAVHAELRARYPDASWLPEVRAVGWNDKGLHLYVQNPQPESALATCHDVTPMVLDHYPVDGGILIHDMKRDIKVTAFFSVPSHCHWRP